MLRLLFFITCTDSAPARWFSNPCGYPGFLFVSVSLALRCSCSSSLRWRAIVMDWSVCEAAALKRGCGAVVTAFDERSKSPLGKMDGTVENTPVLTPKKLQPEFGNFGDILVPNNKTKYMECNFLKSESTPRDTVQKQEPFECRSLESDGYSESSPTDNVSVMSVSVKDYSTMDDEGATPRFDEKKEILGKESEGDVMEIAERVLLKLRSISKSAESARKCILESDSGVEDLDSNDHISDLLGPKRLDFEVIDFDQCRAQTPDLPVNSSLTKVTQHGGAISSNGGKGVGASTKAKKPDHHVRILDARNGIEQEMKLLNDSPVKRSLKNIPEKEQRRKGHGAGALDLQSGHAIPRVCNMANLQEGSGGEDVSRGLDSSSVVGGDGNAKPRLPDSMKPKKIGDAPSGSPIKRPKSIMPDGKGSLVHEETRKRAEELQQLTQLQAERLEDYCHREELSAAHLEEQHRMHEELRVRLEVECVERLRSEAKLMVFCEMLPNVEEKLKNLCDQTLFMKVQLQEEVVLRNKLEVALEQERQERLQLVTKLEEQIDLRNKLEEALEQERKVRVLDVVQLEEHIRLHGELAYKLEEERDEWLKSEADLMVLREMLPNMEEKLVDLNNQVEFLVGQLQEETSRRKKLTENFDQESKEWMQHMAKVEDHFKMQAELAHGGHLETVRDLQNQVLSLARQLQEQIELRKELEDRLESDCEERIQNAVIMSNLTRKSLPASSITWSLQKIEFAKLLDEQRTLLANIQRSQVKEAEILENASGKKAGLLNHQVQNLQVVSENADTTESVFSAKERAIRQTMWTVFQAFCVGMGLMNFIVLVRNPVQSFLQPT